MAANIETIQPKYGARVAERAAGGPSQIAVDAPSYLKGAVCMSVCGTDGAMCAMTLTIKEARELAAILRRMAAVATKAKA